jgi:hypothetical protein
MSLRSPRPSLTSLIFLIFSVTFSSGLKSHTSTLTHGQDEVGSSFQPLTLLNFIKTKVFLPFEFPYTTHTATKIPSMFPQKRNCAASVPIPHSCICERFIYYQDPSTYFLAAELADRSWEYINRSKTHE